MSNGIRNTIKVPKIKINIDTFDIVNNSGDEEKVMNIIENALLEVRGEEVG